MGRRLVIDAMSLLKKDHQKVKKMLWEVGSTREGGEDPRGDVHDGERGRGLNAERAEPPASLQISVRLDVQWVSGLGTSRALGARGARAPRRAGELARYG